MNILLVLLIGLAGALTAAAVAIPALLWLERRESTYLERDADS